MKNEYETKGFGALRSGGPSPSELMHVELAFVPRDTCNSNEKYNGEITNKMMCAADPCQDSCQGEYVIFFVNFYLLITHTLETFHLILIIIIISLFSPPIVRAARCMIR